MRSIRLCATLLSACLMAGCSTGKREETSQGAPSLSETPRASVKAVAVGTGLVARSIGEMAPGDVIVAVNGVALTRREFDVLVTSAVQRASIRLGANPHAMAQIRRQIVQSAVPDFIKRQLLLQEARRLGMKPSSNAMERAERDFGKIASSMGMTADDLRRSQLPQAAVIREAYEAAPLIDALLQEKVYPEVQVTDEFVSNTIFTIGQENKTIEERNEKKKASLEEWRSQTMAGSDFGALADKHSEYPGPAKGDGGYWGVFDRSQIQDRDMSNTIFSMNTNEVSKVLEDEEGYRIVKVLNKNPAVKNEKQEIVERESCELAHIFLMREPLLMNMQPAAMKRELLRQSKERLTDEYVQKLKTQACIEFPHGTNLWAKASGTNTVRRPAHPRRTAVQGIEGTRTNSLRVFGAEVIVPQR